MPAYASRFALCRALLTVGLSVAFGGFAAGSAARAQSLLFDLIDPPAQIAIGGSALYRGTITNRTGSDLQATDLTFNFSGFDGEVVTLEQILGSSDFTLTNGATSLPIDLFRVSFGGMAVPGQSYPIDISLQDTTGLLSDTVTIAPVAASVPGPSALLLFGSGFGGALVALRRRGVTASRQD